MNFSNIHEDGSGCGGKKEIDWPDLNKEEKMDLKCFELVQFTATATFPTNIQLAFLHRSEGQWGTR